MLEAMIKQHQDLSRGRLDNFLHSKLEKIFYQNFRDLNLRITDFRYFAVPWLIPYEYPVERHKNLLYKIKYRDETYIYIGYMGTSFVCRTESCFNRSGMNPVLIKLFDIIIQTMDEYYDQ